MSIENKVFVVIAVVAIGFCGPAIGQSGKKSASGGAPIDAPECETANFKNGPEIVCSCAPGFGEGSVWGSGPYTADSNVCTAARHAGAIGDAGGVIRLTEQPGQSSYQGTSANGVTTGGWGSYDQSFDVIRVGDAPDQTTNANGLPNCSTMPSGVSEFSCFCPSSGASGSIWGSGPFTDDSDICSAARFAGYIDEQGGDVVVLRVQGLESYLGGESYGVTSGDWGSFDKSIVFDWNR